MFGLPAAATKVGNQSRPDTMAFSTLPAGTLPGQRMIIGTRKPPSSAVPFPPANGVLPPSGQVKFSAPLSVEKARIVLFSRPLSRRYFMTAPTMSSSCAIPASWMLQPFSGVRMLSYFSERCVTTCIRVGLSQRKNGAVLLCLVEELERVRQYLVVDGLHALRAQFTRILYFLLSYFAPARLHGRIVYVCRPCVEHIARSNRGFERWWIVAMTGVLHCIEVIEIPVELIEAVQRRQELIEVAQMVLAELAGGVTHGF